MRLGFKEGWGGRKRTIAVCPKCSSDRARYSRRHYDGLWFFLFQVRPVKCSDCGSYFPLAEQGTIRRPETDPDDLHIPFQPSELTEFVAASEDGPEAASLWARSPPICPACGSRAVHSSSPGGQYSITRRLDVRTAYRCGRCNGSFTRLSAFRVLVLLGAGLLFLGGLSYATTAFLGRSPRNSGPRQKGKIQPPPPPVFR